MACERSCYAGNMNIRKMTLTCSSISDAMEKSFGDTLVDQPLYAAGGRYYKYGNRRFPPPKNFMSDYSKIPELSTATRWTEFLQSLHRTGAQWFEGELLERKRIRDRLVIPPFYGRRLDPKERTANPNHAYKMEMRNASRLALDRFIEADAKWLSPQRNDIYSSVHYSRDGVHWRRWGPWSNL